MNRFKIFVISIIIAFITYSCQEPTAPPQSSVKLTWNELTNTFGYASLASFYNYYTPKDSLVKLIDTAFNQSNQKFLFFLEPECTCKIFAREPSYIVKILNQANITEENYEIYSMGNSKSKHPYKDSLNILNLPAVFLVSTGKPVYSILDSFAYFVKSERVDFLEEVILDAIKK